MYTVMSSVAFRSSAQDIDQEVREHYHSPLRLVEASGRGLTFFVNKNWLALVESPHLQLVDLTQLFYDLAPAALDDRLSTTALNRIKDNLITVEDSELHITSLNREIVDGCSGRQRLVLAPPRRRRASIDWSVRGNDATWLTINDKVNWAKRQVADVRKASPELQAFTTARQADVVGQGFARALRRATEEERREGLIALRQSIFVDTRNQLGRPKSWVGMPLTPLPHSKAWLQSQNHRWQLWIERRGIADEVLDDIGLHNLWGEIELPQEDGDPWPWWMREKLASELGLVGQDAGW
jgi:hypothetical protein